MDEPYYRKSHKLPKRVMNFVMKFHGCSFCRFRKRIFSNLYLSSLSSGAPPTPHVGDWAGYHPWSPPNLNLDSRSFTGFTEGLRGYPPLNPQRWVGDGGGWVSEEGG